MRPTRAAAQIPWDIIKERVPPEIRRLLFPDDPTLTLTLRRRDDFLRLRLECFNLQRATDPTTGAPVLIRENPARPAIVVAVFPAQHVAEQVFWEDSETPSDPPVGSRLAGDSRLAFLVPEDVQSIPYTRKALLDWTSWTQHVVPAAQLNPRSNPALRPPNPDETAIELPWWLLMSPHDGAAWAHQQSPLTAPAAYGGRTELWHTHLAALVDGRTDEANDPLRTMRAIWARDPNFQALLDGSEPPPDEGAFGPPGQPFRTSLSIKNRRDIVRSTADYQEPGWTPQPVDVNRLMLSSMGAWVDLRASWENGPTALSEWVHRGTMGREHYVRTVERGYIFPFGHSAVLVDVTERRFRTHNGRRTAYLFKREFIVIRTPVKHYPAPGQTHEGRQFPFDRVETTTLTSPNLDPHTGGVFVPEVGGKPFRFHFVGRDRTGREVGFTAPVVFMEDGPAKTDKTVEQTVSMYDGRPDLNQIPLDGQSVAYAEEREPGDTTLETAHITLGSETLDGTFSGDLDELDQPAFFPKLTEAAVRLQAVEGATGQSLGGTAIEIDPVYIAAGFNTDPGDGPVKKPVNKGALFVVLKNPNPLDFTKGNKGDRAGGLATPNMQIVGMSRTTGPIGGSADSLNEVRGGTWSPEKIFEGMKADLVGGISLWDVIKFVTDGGFPDPEDPDPEKVDKTLRMSSQQIKDADGLPEALETKIRWKPELKKFADGLFKPEADGKEGSFLLEAFYIAHRDPAKSTSQITADLQNATITLFGDSLPLIAVPIRRLAFISTDGASPDVIRDTGEVTFGGPLRFIQEFRDYLKSIGGGFDVSITPTEVSASLIIPIPDITVGVFSMSNLSLGLGLTVPFTGDPLRFRACFCSPEDPFLLTIMIFGGGGYACLDLGADGFERLEAALEFGAAASISFGIASGSVYMLAGIYFLMEQQDNGDQAITLEGYFRAGGEMTILGIASVSLEIYLGLTYVDKPPELENKTIGRAMITVEVEILGIGTSVSFEAERKFGGGGDPTFGDTVPDKALWDEYAAAFDPVEV